jgi:hypothetical protein
VRRHYTMKGRSIQEACGKSPSLPLKTPPWCNNNKDKKKKKKEKEEEEKEETTSPPTSSCPT